MSIDTKVWTKRTGSLSSLPLGEGWEDEGDALAKEGDGWLVTLMEPREADATEAPPQLRDAEPAVSYCVEISLEPAGAPGEGLAELAIAVEGVGRAWGGATLDPSSGQVRSWP